MMKYYATIAAILLFMACNNDRKAIESLEKTTMDLHDEAMKAMGPMNKTARELRAILATTDSLSVQYKDIQQALTQIEHAEADMMRWMENYNAPDKDTPSEKAIQYLGEQKTAIEKNFKDIQAAAEKGKSLMPK